MKSNVSDYLELMHAIYDDACMKCIADVSDLRDMKTIISRVEHEGISFLTITLPGFCRDFEKSLELGYIDSTFFRSFAKNGSIPAFLQGMISHVFDRESGRIYDKDAPSTRAIASDIPVIVECVRQLCLTFKKLEIGCTPEREHLALANFVTIERSFETFSLQEEDHASFLAVSSMLWSNLVKPIRLSDCRPGHGPGATAERVSGNQKFNWGRWHDRLEPYFPLINSAIPIGVVNQKEVLDSVTIVPEHAEDPVRVICVPKTLKSPRIIAIEPCCMQYTQQGIRNLLYKAIESYWLTKGHVNFSDQTVNQELAMISSKDGRLATIDLSDASDRVPLSLAMAMFQSNPDLQDAIDACRSKSATLPRFGALPNLHKFASMGSALCFPIEAMYFYTICVIALLKAMHLSQCPLNIFKVTRDIYVYGDDILVPADMAITVLDYLQKYNCKVNTNKTFVSGNFRESCGIDAFDGYPVTPVYVRQRCPKNRQQAKLVISWVCAANFFYKKGFWRTTQLMFSKLEKAVGSIPYTSETSEGLGRYSFLGYRSVSRWNADYQRFEINALCPKPVYRTDRLEGYGALQKSFQRLQSKTPEPWSLDEPALSITTLKGVVTYKRNAHLERSALHGAVTLKRRWIPA